MEKKDYLVPEELLAALEGYLQTKPYFEVHGLMSALAAVAKAGPAVPEFERTGPVNQPIVPEDTTGE